MKREICAAFCNALHVRDVPFGMAVTTDVAAFNGDPITFYISNPQEDGFIRLVDSGLTIPYLLAVGADFDNPSRKQALDDILRDYEAEIDEDRLEIKSKKLTSDAVSIAAVQFVHMLVRIQSLEHMARDKAASTFKEDAERELRDRLSGRAIIYDRDSRPTEFSDWEPDLVASVEGRDAVAIFFVQTEHRIMEALLLHSEALLDHRSTRVVSLLERETSVSKKTLQRATNRLEAIPIYEGDRDAALSRVTTEVVGRVYQ